MSPFATIKLRGRFAQGSTGTAIFTLTTFDGRATDPTSISYKIVRNSDDEEVKTGTPEKIRTGLYVFDWKIASDAMSGDYTITYTYTVDSVEFTESISQPVAADSEDTTLYSGRTILMKDGLEIMIDCAQCIPVYFQQARPSHDRKSFHWTKGNWNQKSGIKIYRNKSIISEGFTIDFPRGVVEFDDPLSNYDNVFADYNFRWFDDADLERFIHNGIQKVNIYPPFSNYNVANVPEPWAVAALYGAAVDALRNLLLCINFEQPAQFFGGNDEASKRFQQLESLKKNYEDDLQKMLEQKKLGPYKGLTKAIVVPEYTLPGGRSRWFRYLFNGAT